MRSRTESERCVAGRHREPEPERDRRSLGIGEPHGQSELHGDGQSDRDAEPDARAHTGPLARQVSRDPPRQSTLIYPYTAQDFVGYAIGRPSAKITCVEATWTQPKVTCGKTDQRFSISISIDGWTSSRLHVNAPSPRLVSVGTETECINGKPVISTWHQANPVDTFEYFSGLQAVTPAVGDIIWAQIRFANGAFTMALRDKTSGEQASITQTVAKIARVAAVWEVSTVFTNCATKCRPTPLAKFSPIVFSGVDDERQALCPG